MRAPSSPRQARAELNAFRPHFALLWGDDQCESMFLESWISNSDRVFALFRP